MKKNKQSLMRAPITEIFLSRQGEGPFLGQKQIFIRFFGCNLGCIYCDEIEKKSFENLSVEEVINRVENLNGHQKKEVFFISLTGGEPLLYSRYLRKLLPKLKNKSFKIYLETNGILTKALKEIIKFVDVIAMDIKLPSALRQKNYWLCHYKFLQLARKKIFFVKIVITRQTKESEIKKAVSIMGKVNSATALILQPVSPYGKIKSTVREHKLLSFKKIAESRLKKVKILPQMHKIIGVK